MLRVILGLAGASLIALGLFGGQSLELLHARVSDILNPQLTQGQLAAADLDPSAEQVAAAKVTAAEQTTVAATESPLAEPRPEPRPEPRQAQLTASAEAASAAQVATSVSVAEVPASARNKEVAVARALLNGDVVKQKQSPLQTVALGNEASSKKEAVAGVIQTTGGNTENKTLVVLKESVNLRRGPSTEHAVVLELTKGQELMEFKRDGKWVHVGAYGTAGKIGWVHRTLVGAN